MAERQVLELVEYKSLRLKENELSVETGKLIYKEYKNQIDIEFPSPRTEHLWKLNSQGWAGYIALDDDLGISLKPKVPIRNIFAMLEYAYKLESFRFLKGLYQSDSLDEFYENLAKILSEKVLHRNRQGLYKEYSQIQERLSFVRGRMEIQELVRKPWQIKPTCRYDRHTADLAENQILVWTLLGIIRGGVCKERVLPTIRSAYRAMRGNISTIPFRSSDCLDRRYNRLNLDYQQLHSLCYFFLENSGPRHDLGEKAMLPFLVDMARLYELFVAEWLKAHLPAEYELKDQEEVKVDSEGHVHFNIDLVITDSETGSTKWVLDTKYKRPEYPASSDIQQVAAYALAKNSPEAVLIYPVPVSFDGNVGKKRVRCLTFSLDNDLETAGSAFLAGLGINRLRSN